MHNDNSTQNRTTLVLGGTGKTGRRVVERLEARGLPVRVGSRSGEPPFDWEIPATWAPALDAVGSVYLTYYPDLACRVPSRPPDRSPSWRSRAAPPGWCFSQAEASRSPSVPSRPFARREPS